MSSPHMSFRLNEYQLAKALRILVTLEPNMPIPSFSQAAKTIIIDWIAKHSINASLVTSQADIEAIKTIINLPVEQINPYTTIQTLMRHAAEQSSSPVQPKQTHKTPQQIQRELEEDRLFTEMRRESLKKKAEEAQTFQQDPDFDNQIELASQASKRVLHKAPIERETESVISTVTDFSPPPEWKQ